MLYRRVILLAILSGCSAVHRTSHVQPADEYKTPRIVEILEGRVPVGTRLWLNVRCTEARPGDRLGPPPVTRSDWAVRDSTGAIYVVGPIPPGCTAGVVPPEGVSVEFEFQVEARTPLIVGAANYYLMRLLDTK